MTRSTARVAVTSRSFSRNPVLRAELLDRYENVTFNDAGASLKGDSLVAFLEGHEKAITALETVDAAVISKLSGLKVLSKYGVGIDMIDIAALKAAGVGFGWTKGVNRRSVAELTLAFAIMLLHRAPRGMAEVRGGQWKQITGAQLSDKVVGIVGCGNVGKELVRLLQPFRCTVLIHDSLDMADFAGAFDAEQVTLDALLVRADVVTLHVPLDSTTRGLVGAREIGLMRRSAVLINAARGGIVDEAALLSALETGMLTGAALDVFSREPPETDVAQKLIAHPDVLVTPHLGGSAEEAILAMGRAAIAGLDDYVL